MADIKDAKNADAQTATSQSAGTATPSSQVELEKGTYEIIRGRLKKHGEELRTRLSRLDAGRRDVFGTIETKLLATQRVTTDNNCVPRDIVALGERFVFGYNVHIGLKSETSLSDVFTVYRFHEGQFHAEPLELIQDKRFEEDFKQLYKYYKQTQFAKFMVNGPHLYFVFRVGKTPTDIKSFKWLIKGDKITYLDNRSDHEVRYPAQHEFEWQRTHRDLHRYGKHPHISIEDRLFVETVGGDLTIKIEDNTDDGAGIYSEPVDDKDQTLDDAEIFYVIIGNLVLLKMKPYKEKDYRYLIYSEKNQRVIRMDSIQEACILLPEGHGIVFSNGYFLQSGEYKVFEKTINDLVFERRIVSPNGEDFLFVFYNRDSGEYVLLSYNLIQQKIESPLLCHGFSLFENGQLVVFRADSQPQKSHALQIWQTPYVGVNFTAHAKTDAFLYRVGNKDVVRAMAGSYEILGLIEKEDSYANLYLDMVKSCTVLVDTFPWLKEKDAAEVTPVVNEIKGAASSAIEEFDRVVRVRRDTKEKTQGTTRDVKQTITAAASRIYGGIQDFVASLSDIRKRRGEVISLKELKYADLAAIDALEKELVENGERISLRCVEFLLRDDALLPYQTRVAAERDEIGKLTKVADAKQLEQRIATGAGELEMLVEIVSNLKIDDATQRTKIIDNISSIYSQINQSKATLKKKSQELFSVEGVAEFNSQIKLLSQGVVNYLDICDSPEKCDEYLTKLLVQIEELEGKFAEFDEYVVQLAEKREEVYSAFDSRKLALVEARNKRAAALAAAADRILKGVATRLASFTEINDIHAYFASDLMIEKVRDIVKQLKDLDDSVKVDDIQSRLKTIREDAIRQLKDRKELFVDGENVIRFGKHKFSVNVQQLDLTTILKEGDIYFHLTGTKFLEAIQDETFLNSRDVWDQEVVSEDKHVYRGEYLAYLIYREAKSDLQVLADLRSSSDAALTEYAQKFMAPRYSEGYVKGVHDQDAAGLLKAILDLDHSIGKLRYHPRSRALANLFWKSFEENPKRNAIIARVSGITSVGKLFPRSNGREQYIEEIRKLIEGFCSENLPDFQSYASQAARYLFDELADAKRTISHQAAQLARAFHAHLDRRNFGYEFQKSLAGLQDDVVAQYELSCHWLTGFLQEMSEQIGEDFLFEASSVIAFEEFSSRELLHGEPTRKVEKLIGNHPLLDQKGYTLDFNEFMYRLERFQSTTVPRFEAYVAGKKKLLEKKRAELRLEEFKPKVLTSFVRNRLIDEVYLPLIGDNLAKQMGVVGEQKRTDLMGLLLLISPPGYGKTTLMEYVANRLGLTFIKINGPAVGHRVTSLDPQEASNASAREEIEKLNLSLEMGDNIMIYLDDIQHCNPELLQKFISLCDGSRRIEGVYKGKTRTYDLRGRKVSVVMAGNPYTESGSKFQIPDMLANRADTYNLGDVVGDSREAFELSYLENALTSNSVLQKLQSRSRQDLYGLIKIASQGTQQGVVLEGSYSAEEINEIVAVLKHLLKVRDVLLKVNEQYIYSAAQADAYRTEPAFKMQGSYRDMNKIAEKIVAVMNDAELQTLILTHYENQSQTLTTGAESNLLKFKDLIGVISEEEAKRWAEIKKTFKRNLVIGSSSSEDRVGQLMGQISLLSEGLGEIRSAVEGAAKNLISKPTVKPEAPVALDPQQLTASHLASLVQVVGQFGQKLESLHSGLNSAAEQISKSLQESRIPIPVPDVVAESPAVVDAPIVGKPTADRAVGEKPVVAEVVPVTVQPTIEVINKIPTAFLDVIKAQFSLMQQWFEPVLKMTGSASNDVRTLQATMAETLSRYEKLVDKISSNSGE